MSKITSLTKEQTEKFPAYVDKWTRIGLETAPADRTRAEAGLTKAYEAVGLPAPRFVWCSSPLAAGITRSILQDKKIQEKIGDSVRASVRASVRDSVWDSVGASVRDSVRGSVWASVGDSVGDSVRASVRDSVWDSVGDSVGASVWASVWASVRDSVRGSVWDSVGDSVRASVRASVRDSVRDSVGDSVGDSVWASGYGQHDANWIAFYDFFRNECDLIKETDKLQGLTEITKAAGWYLPHKNICWISERHCVVHQDENRRIHCEDGPAIAYPDGWSIYAIHGVRVPEYVIMCPQEITVEKIDQELNAEIRRVMIDRYKAGQNISGIGAYLRDCGAEVLDHDPRYGRLLRRRLSDDEDIVLLHLLNTTPEPEGPLSEEEARSEFGDVAVEEALSGWQNSPLYQKEVDPRFKVYFIRVSPDLRPLPPGHWSQDQKREYLRSQKPQALTALNAVASTFGKRGEDFGPVVMS